MFDAVSLLLFYGTFVVICLFQNWYASGADEDPQEVERQKQAEHAAASLLEHVNGKYSRNVEALVETKKPRLGRRGSSSGGRVRNIYHPSVSQMQISLAMRPSLTEYKMWI